jgi:hypothetical protein
MPTFGNMDPFQNRHDQNKHVAQLQSMTDKAVITAGTFHSVTGDTQRLLYSRIRNANHAQEVLDKARVLTALTFRQYYFHFTVMWHCQPGVHGPHGTHTVSRTAGKSNDPNGRPTKRDPKDKGVTLAVCQRPLLLEPVALDSAPLHLALKNMRDQQPFPPGARTDGGAVNEAKGGQECGHAFIATRLDASEQQGGDTAAHCPDADKTNAIVALPLGDKAVIVSAVRFIKSLRRVGSCAHVLLVASPSLNVATVTTAVTGLGPGTIVTAGADNTVLSPAAFTLAVAAVLQGMSLTEDCRVLTMPADAMVQRDPFTMLKPWTGLALTLAEPMEWSLKTRCWIRWDHQLPLSTAVHPWFALAPAAVFTRFALARNAMVKVRRGRADGRGQTIMGHERWLFLMGGTWIVWLSPFS